MFKFSSLEIVLCPRVHQQGRAILRKTSQNLLVSILLTLSPKPRTAAVDAVSIVQYCSTAGISFFTPYDLV